MEYQILHKKLNDLKSTVIPKQNLEKGITIVIPVFDGGSFIESCLGSIVSQKITDAKYEVILVLNGDYKNDYEKIINGEYRENIDITVLINDDIGASAARNMGMKCAKYSHVTFIDIDDYISEDFIQANFNHIAENTITFSQIHDDSDGEINKDNSLNHEIEVCQNKTNFNLLDLNKIASITVCKVIPKEILLLQQFRTHLRSGEDTVFYCELFINSRPKLSVIPTEEQAIYYRRIRENSVSRKESSFDFLIFQRLEILEILDAIVSNITNPILLRFVISKYNAQISFMNRYLISNFNERKEILNAVRIMSLKNFNYSILNRDLADTLVVSYCFPPYSDTSATIVAKKIINNDKIVDVVSNNMSKIRTTEESLNEIVKPLVGKKVTVNTQASFSNMYFLNSYIDITFRTFLNNIDKYKEVYSRAMFPISHIPQFFMKIVNPNIKWIAEFSDPLLYNIESEIRHASMQNDLLVQSLANGMLNQFSKYVDDNLFNLSELIPFALADELIFTNENQLEYMISRFDDNEKQIIRDKSTIQQHPTLTKEYYNLDNVDSDIDESLINIAYFGNFYSKRSYDNFLSLIKKLNENFRYFFKLHIYTNKNMLSELDLEHLEENKISVHPYLSFTQFLNVTTKFDVLILNDASTIGDKFINPYLPSKLSDYLGSGTAIIGITEKDSILSNMEYDSLYKIDISNFDDNELLTKEISDNKYVKLFDNINNDKTERYITENEDFIQIKDPNSEMNLSSDLQLDNMGNRDWLIKPKGPRVTKENDYEVEIINNDLISKEILVKSFYGVKNVIEVNFSYSNNKNDNYTTCITKLSKSFKKHIIPPQTTLLIKIKYLNNYRKPGFIEAGRLRVKDI